MHKDHTRRNYEIGFSLPEELPDMTPAQIEAAARLGKAGISSDQVNDLRRRLRVARATLVLTQSNAKATAGWPTAAEEGRALAELADLAQALSLKLKGLSPRARAEVATAAMVRLGDVSRPSQLAGELMVLAQGIRDRIGKVPTTSKAPVSFVSAVVEALGDAAGKPSMGSSSRFMNVCKAAFVLAGWDKDPKRAVEAYIKSSSSQGDEMG